MLNKVMQLSLNNRLLVILAGLLVLIGGTLLLLRIPIDVFPELTAPTVTVMTEAHGMAPEDVEMLVTFPIETAVNGATGVRRVRSTSIQGFSTVLVEFDWGTDIYRARQIVNEKLQTINSVLPTDAGQPTMAPITSILGEIMTIGLTSRTTSDMDLRSLADYNLRRRLLAIPGVSEVKVYGGEVKQYQIQLNPGLLVKYDVSLEQVMEAASKSSINASGGFYVESGQEYLIRGLGRTNNIRDLEYTVITTRNNMPILLRDVGQINFAPATKLGEASIDGAHGVLIVISRQPDANTLELTERIKEVLGEIRSTLPPGIELHEDLFSQADFISIAIRNVIHALRDGAILVIVVLLLFIGNVRAGFISILAIPLSIVIAFFALRLLNLSVNTMTLGGIAIAIGVLVDDAIIYVENVFRRVKENAAKPALEQRPFYSVVCDASAEIRTPIVMATFIVIIVFLPLFFLSGIEGRMLQPLGLSYTLSILASLVVAVTITPALSYAFLKVDGKKKTEDSRLVRCLKRFYEPALSWSMAHSKYIISSALILFIIAVLLLPFMGRSFLPEFNEGTFNISIASVPGTALQESDKIGRMAETMLQSHPAITTVSRRTGRTELDAHSLGSHAHEVEVKADFTHISKNELVEDMREKLSLLPGTIFNIGQPITHRIDHMLSGTRASIAVKIFGPDLYRLRRLAKQCEAQLRSVEGVVDLAVDQQTDIPQVRIKANRQKMALYGLTVADLTELIDVAFLGEKISEIYEGQNQFDLVVRYAPQYRDNLDAIRSSLIDTPTGGHIPLTMVADISLDKGPNFISRENVQRKIVVQANVADRDLRSVVEEMQSKISGHVDLPQGYYIQYGGQFESEAAATRIISLLSILSIFLILIALYSEFGNFRQALLVMVNLPLALIGGVISIFFTKGIITIASLVGFITLFGIAVRNGILMVSHYNHLINVEGRMLRDAVLQGSLEKLSPILMTALTTGLALLPLAIASDKPGSEIQSPLSVVVLGGLITSTFLNMFVIPVLFVKWGRKREKGY